MAQHFAADAALHLGERQGRAVLPRQNLAVHYGAVRQQRAERLQFRKAIGDQLLAARPHIGAAAAANQLAADAVPLPLHLPFPDIAQIRDGAFQRIGKEERIGPAGIGIAHVGRDEPAPEIGRGLPLAHEPVRDDFRGKAADLGDGAHYQALRDAHAKFAGDELVPDEALALVHLAPRGGQRVAAHGIAGIAQGQQALLHPIMQRQCDDVAAGRQEQRDGLGEIADRLIAFAEQPLRHARLFDGPLRQFARFQQALGTAADQEVDGPRRVLRRARRRGSA